MSQPTVTVEETRHTVTVEDNGHRVVVPVETVRVVTAGTQGPPGPPSLSPDGVITTEGDLIMGAAGGAPTAFNPAAKALLYRDGATLTGVAVGAAGGVVMSDGVTWTNQRLARYEATRFEIAPGAPSLTTKLQAAIDAITAAGGGILALPEGDFTGLDGITLKDGVYLSGAGVGATVLDFSAMTVPVTNSAIYGAGSLTALPVLSANIALHGLSITFASAPAVVAGDVLLIQDSADHSFSLANEGGVDRTYYRAGEYVRVKSVAGNVATLTNRTFAAYTSGGTVSVYKLTPIHTGVSGATMRFKAGHFGAKVRYGRGLAFRDLDLAGSDLAQLAVDKSYEVAIADVVAFDANPEGVGIFNLGVELINCQRVAIDACHLETGRHGLTLTGDNNATGTVPNREIVVTDSVIAGHSLTGHTNGCNLHGNVEYVAFRGCVMPHGLTLAGDHTSTTDCDIFTGATSAVHFTEVLGLDHTIANCRLVARAGHAAGEGHVYCLLVATLTRAGGTLRILDNRFDLGDYGSGTVQRGVYVYNQLGATTDVHVEFAGNEVLSAKTAAGVVYAAMIRADAGKGFRTVRVNRNRCHNCGITNWLTMTPETGEIVDNVCTGAPEYGVIGTPNTSPPYVATVRLDGNLVLRAKLAGLRMDGVATGTLIVQGNTSLDHNQGGLGNTQTGTSVRIITWQDVVSRDNTIGDRQGVPTQAGLDSIRAVTTLHDIDNIVLGTVTGRDRSTVTATHLRARGAGSPEGAIAASIGSSWHRTDGGNDTAQYVKGTGTGNTGWRAVTTAAP